MTRIEDQARLISYTNDLLRQKQELFDQIAKLNAKITIADSCDTMSELSAKLGTITLYPA